MTENVNPILGKIEYVFEILVWDNMVEAGIVSMFAMVPALGIWPIGPIIKYLVRMFSGQLYEKLRLVVDINAISLIDDAHKREFDKAAVKLAIIAKEKGIDSREFKTARERAKVDLAQFVHFDGV